MIEINTVNKIPTKTYLYSLTKLILFLSVPALLLSSVDNTPNTFFNFLFMFFVLFGLAIYFIIWLRLKNFSFVITDTTLDVKSGILTKNTETIPFSSIQNIVESTGVLMRLFGISKLKIWDASIKSSDRGQSATAEVILEKNDVEVFKIMILNR
jgi:uncharacterized membrane protein YdbT with pleckstrin-like domain